MKPTKSSILPFDPISLEPDSFVIYITPPMARYILEHHNFDNREKKATQVTKIGQSVDTFGWLFDGKAVCFNTDGNLTEKQHTLTYISRDTDDDAQYRVVITLGCVKDAFSNQKKNSSDEFLVEKKSPLVMPPEFNELPIPNQNENTNQKKENNIKSLISDNNGNNNQEASNSDLEGSILSKIKNK